MVSPGTRPSPLGGLQGGEGEEGQQQWKQEQESRSYEKRRNEKRRLDALCTLPLLDSLKREDVP